MSSRGMWNGLTYIASVDKTKMVICRRTKDNGDVCPLRREISIGRKIRLFKINVFLILVYVEEIFRRLTCEDSWLFRKNS